MVMSLELDIEKNNKKICELSHNYDFIHGLYWIQKSRIGEGLVILKKELNKGGFVGVKFHGSFEELPVTASVYQPIMKLLNEKNSILLVHAGRYKDGSPESNTSYYHPLKLAKNYPNIRIIIAHMGGNDTSIVKEAVDNAKNIPNVYFDTSGITTPFRIEYATKIIGPERIIFGSDSPWCSYRAMYYCVEDAMIDEEAKELIFSKNFSSLLNKEKKLKHL